LINFFFLGHQKPEFRAGSVIDTAAR
jgi:hypothetical protein